MGLVVNPSLREKLKFENILKYQLLRIELQDY